MKDTLATLGLAALVCLPCLLVLGGGALVASGALTLALARDPAVQAAALLAVAVGAAFGWRYLARRRACATERPDADGRQTAPRRDSGAAGGR